MNRNQRNQGGDPGLPEESSRKGIWRWDFPFNPAKFPFFYGWIILVGSTIGLLCSLPGQTMGVSVFTEVLMREMGLSRLQLSSAYLVGTMLSGFSLPMAGTLLDRVGARRMTTWVSIIFGVVLVGHIFLDDIAAFLRKGVPAEVGGVGWLGPFLLISFAFFLIRFLGQGCLTMGSRAMLGKWFNRRRGFVFALSGVGISFLFSAAPKVLQALIDRLGWEGAYIVMGLSVGLLAGSVAWLFFRESPEEIGQFMDGDPEPTGPVLPEKNLDLIIRKEMTRAEALRTYSFWIYNLGLSFNGLIGTGYTFHVLSIGEETGVGTTAILNFFLAIAAVSVVANLVSGWMADRTRMKYILVACMAGQAVGILALILLPGPVGIALLIAGWGIAGGMFNMISGVVWPRYFGRKYLGAITGVHISSTVFGSAAGPVLFSLGQTFSGSYMSVYIVGLIFAVALTIGAFFADNPQRRYAASEP